jgi:hypothetical protein
MICGKKNIQMFMTLFVKRGAKEKRNILILTNELTFLIGDEMFKQKYKLEDMADDGYPRGFGIHDGKSNLEVLLERAKSEDKNLVINCSAQNGITKYNYDDFIIKLNEIKKGKYSRIYPELCFEDIEFSDIRDNFEKIGKKLTFSVSGCHTDVRNFMIRERNYAQESFNAEFCSKYDYANKDVEKSIDLLCHKGSLSYLKIKLSTLKDFTVSTDQTMIFKPMFGRDSLLVNKLLFKHQINLSVSGKQCEVDLIIEQLNEIKKDLMKNQGKIKERNQLLAKNKEYI